MAATHGQQLALIPHDYQGQTITQRSKDGYINATAMCRAVGKPWSDYRRHPKSEPFLDALAADLQTPKAQLVRSYFGTPGGDARNQGTWVHPQVAVHLAQWLSPEFAVKVSGWVIEWTTGQCRSDMAWRQFHDRISLTHDCVPEGYFCVFRESASLYAGLISGGAQPGTKMILDISIGLHWARHWKCLGLEERFGAAKKFEHYYPAYFPQAMSNPQRPWCYPDEALGAFRAWMRDVYEKTKLPAYLNDQVAQRRLAANDANQVMAALTDRSARRAAAQPA